MCKKRLRALVLEKKATVSDPLEQRVKILQQHKPQLQQQNQDMKREIVSLKKYITYVQTPSLRNGRRTADSVSQSPGQRTPDSSHTLTEAPAPAAPASHQPCRRIKNQSSRYSYSHKQYTILFNRYSLFNNFRSRFERVRNKLHKYQRICQ